ncbi:hypothetical protein SDC9_155699 [bioreactor metagenome]|uniref:Uncharacterized protein n=1 Tax=bioreactor metagenome TaxID=1076179 RepID=A0A645F2G7_9ZZZZ
MYGGSTEDCVLQFDNSLIGVIYDKFGENTKMKRLNNDVCAATVKVQVSPTFWGWLFQFPEKMKISSPENLVEEYKIRCEKICK